MNRINKLQIFNNEEFGEIRIITITNESWFVGKDVAIALKYKNTKDALEKHVNEEDKQILQRSQNATFKIPNRGLTIINESGLYSLIFGSKLESAKRFKHRVTSEVLPAIRKTGRYEITQKYKPTRPLTTDDYEDAAKTIAKCHNSRLPIVIDLYRKAGLDIGKIPEISHTEQIDEDKDDLVELLNRYSLKELCERLPICKSSIYYYRIGKHFPQRERREEIIRILEE